MYTGKPEPCDRVLRLGKRRTCGGMAEPRTAVSVSGIGRWRQAGAHERPTAGKTSCPTLPAAIAPCFCNRIANASEWRFRLSDPLPKRLASPRGRKRGFKPSRGAVLRRKRWTPEPDSACDFDKRGELVEHTAAGSVGQIAPRVRPRTSHDDLQPVRCETFIHFAAEFGGFVIAQHKSPSCKNGGRRAQVQHAGHPRGVDSDSGFSA